MKFLSVYKTVERGVPPTPQEMAEMGALIEELTRSRVLLATEGCLPSVTGARVRQSQGTVTVTDGPFAESKEVIAGFALLQTRSKEEAIDLTRRFLKIAGDGECEIRQVFEGEENCAAEPPREAKASERPPAHTAAAR